MGGKFSRKSRDHKYRDADLPPNDVHIYDDRVVNKLREDLYEDTEKFLLNNILMSIQFYENFEREMKELRKNQVSALEMEINKALADHQKHCLLPDTVMECINDRVRFRPFHGSKKFQSEPLLPQRIYIVHDNIEVIYEGETSEYSVVDGPIHRAVLEKAEKPGYVQLREVDFLNIKGQNDPEGSDAESETEGKSGSPYSPMYPLDSPASSPALSISGEKQRQFTKKENTAISPLVKETHFLFSESENVPETKLTRTDSRKSSLKEKLWRSKSFTLSSNRNVNSNTKIKPSNSEENINKEMKKPAVQNESDEYGYATFTRISTQKPLDQVRAKRNPSDASSLSTFCITEVKVRKINRYEDSDSDDDSVLENGKRKPPVKKKIQDFYEIKRFFNSVEFFAHFGDVFTNIYPLLKFTSDSFRKAMTQGGVIHCETYDKNHNRIFCEVIPTVATGWPNIAFEWYMRHRQAVLDPTKNMVYQWPTKNMIKKVKSLQANVLPFGYVAKRGLHENNALEWSLAFPAAERYMETCMSHSQVRCYLFILALYKTFMEQCDTKLGLAPHHIRTLIFWEIEKNFVTWPEERLGSKMLQILRNLYKHLSMGYLPDYFVKERNLLESTPRKYLGKSQEQLHHIIERPVLHVIVAMRNLRYTSGTFFPTLDFKRLYSIIIANDSLSLINPALSNMIINNIETPDDEPENEFKENAIPFWNKQRKTEDYERKWKRKLRRQIDLEKKQEHQNNIKIRRQSVDSINLQETIPSFDYLKRRALLEFFIAHFVAVAKKCCSYEAYQYALVILNHCRALATLLGEQPSGEVEARPWKAKIKEQIQICMSKMEQVEITAVRDSRQFTGTTFSISENHSLNMRNLQNTFNSNNLLHLEPPKKKKSRPENLQITADVHFAENTSPRSIILGNNSDSTDL